MASAPARAQGTKAGSAGRAAAVEKARDHFQQGQRLFTVSRYREALEQFKNAFLAVEDPVFLFNIAQCHRLLGEKRRGGAVLPPLHRGGAQRERAGPGREVDRRAGGGVRARPAPVTGVAGARAGGDGAEAEPTARDAADRGPPAGGSRRLRRRRSPPPMGAGPSLEPPPVAGEPAPGLNLTAPPPADTEPRPIYKKWWFWAGVGAAVVVGGVVAAAAAKGRGVSCGAGVQRCEQL